MLIENSFDVAADPDEVFAFLQDAHNVAACFPGAELVEDLGGDSYRGKVKIKVGPVTAAYQGVAKIVEKDQAQRVAVLLADGKDSRGAGTAKAKATMRVTPAGEGAHVALETDLTISGKLAQFGRGIMSDVSGRMVGELASRVRQRIENGGEAPAAPAPTVAAGTAATTPPAATTNSTTTGAATATATRPVTDSAPQFVEAPPMKASVLIRIVLAGYLERWAARLRKSTEA
ncbi:SRPBCC family protein [Amycolatopsis sp. FDAARGOS 1241]|uniref:SRPBCC family protein n=1 Tax=Amycolatopsis sp. FDAARGOS 1241 TaxID=2778070 RepID=UPI0019511739|nr:SRPBCC family protein [Amycolatopsis sp. FDAARGOS 1241]QRP49345.1 SRPBCC family protein [Amycolatopsis sp. FDAARGOS 1241]